MEIKFNNELKNFGFGLLKLVGVAGGAVGSVWLINKADEKLKEKTGKPIADYIRPVVSIADAVSAGSARFDGYYGRNEHNNVISFRTYETPSYGKTLEKIINSDLWGSRRTDLLGILEDGWSPNTYGAICSVLDSSAWDSEKMNNIKIIIAKEKERLKKEEESYGADKTEGH